MIHWQPFIYQDKTYEVDHLHPRLITIEQPAKNDKPACLYPVQIIYSLHTFTRGRLADEQIEEALCYSDRREKRVFDFQRYKHSLKLPEIIGNLQIRRCYHTGHRNFFIVEIVEENGQASNYEVFFQASKSEIRGAVNLFIQSAFIRDPGYGGRSTKSPMKRPNRISLFMILYNTLNNRPIRAQK